MLEVLLIHIIIILYNLNHCKKSYLFVLRHQQRTMHEHWIGESNSCGLKKRVTKKVSFHFMKRRLKRSRPHTGNRYGCISTKKVVQGCRFFINQVFIIKYDAFVFLPIFHQCLNILFISFIALPSKTPALRLDKFKWIWVPK